MRRKGRRRRKRRDKDHQDATGQSYSMFWNNLHGKDAWVRAYGWLILVAVPLKLTQHLKSMMLQLIFCFQRTVYGQGHILLQYFHLIFKSCTSYFADEENQAQRVCKTCARCLSCRWSDGTRKAASRAQASPPRCSHEASPGDISGVTSRVPRGMKGYPAPGGRAGQL